MTDELGSSVQNEGALEEIRRDIGAVVSKLDLLIAASKEPAHTEEG